MSETFDFDVLSCDGKSVRFTAKLSSSLKKEKRAIKLGAAIKWGAKNGVNLKYVRMSAANLYMSSFRHQDMRGTRFYKTNLCHADLRRANLQYATLLRADLRCAVLLGTNLSGVDMRWTKLIRARLDGANLTGTNFLGATVGHYTLKRLLARAWNINGDYEVFAFETIEGGLLVRAERKSLFISDFLKHVQSEPTNDAAKHDLLEILHFFRACGARTLGCDAMNISCRVVTNNKTDDVVFEAFNHATAKAINTKKYKAVPILDYLVSLNKKGAAQ